MRNIALVGLGSHARAKYVPLLRQARLSGAIGDVHLVELRSRQAEVESYISRSDFPVARRIYVATSDTSGFDREGEAAVRELARPGDGLIVATEARAHQGYVSAAMRAGVD